MYKTSQNLIDNVISHGQWRDFLDIDINDAKNIVDIDLRQKPSDSTTFNHHCKWCWSDQLVPDVYLFFPNTNDHQMVCTNDFSSFSALDKRIERALKNTKIQHEALSQHSINGLKLAIACGDHIFRVWGVRQEHTYYLYMMEVFTRSCSDGYVHDPLNKVPALVEMDGTLRFINVIVLDVAIQGSHQVYNNGRLLLPLDLKSVTDQKVPLNHPMFNCERIKRAITQAPVLTTLSKELAVHDTKNVCINTDEMFFFGDDDDDDNDDDGDSITGSVETKRSTIIMIGKDKGDGDESSGVYATDDLEMIVTPRLKLINNHEMQQIDDFL